MSTNKLMISAAALGLVCVGFLLSALVIGLGSRYQIVQASERGAVWRLDSRTGYLSLCAASGLLDEPLCGPWGAKLYEKPKPAQTSGGLQDAPSDRSYPDPLEAAQRILRERAAASAQKPGQ